MDEGPIVVPEVRPFKERDLTLGLPHIYALALIGTWAMLFFYFEFWISSFIFFGFFWLIGKAALRKEPFFTELLLKIPFTPRIFAP